MHSEQSLKMERSVSKLAEIINPVNLPEAGFQSYEELKSDASVQRGAFLADEVINPVFDYPGFKDLSKLDKGIVKLMGTMWEVDLFDLKPVYARVTKSSLEFRVAEMEFVKLLARLDFLVKEDGDEDEIRHLVEQARLLNEHLYSKTKPEIVTGALNEIFSNIDSKTLSPSAQKIYEELTEGFYWKGKAIPALERPEDGHTYLPDFSDVSLVWAGEHILEKNAHIQSLIEEFWEEKVEEKGEDYVCPPADIAEAFEQTLSLLDPKKESGVSVKIDPNATALSWDSTEMAVIVGARRKAIDSREKLFEKVLHELVVHGGRAINGLKTQLPVLGTGLFTDTPRPDYLTFEEGFASTIEDIVSGEQPEWGVGNIAYYLNVDLANKGNDFRSVFEITWRYSLLMGIEGGVEVTDDLKAKHKKKAYGLCVRTFRGTQPNLSDQIDDIVPMTYNKDLAYLEGRVLAMKYIATLYESRDSKGLDRLFLAKYDPTNPVQDAIVKSVLTQ